MTMSIAFFDCPHCVDEFAFDYQKVAKLNYGWRARVRCPGCGNIVEVVMQAYTVTDPYALRGNGQLPWMLLRDS